MRVLEFYYSYRSLVIFLLAEARILVAALHVVYYDLLKKNRERRKRIFPEKELWFTYDMSAIHVDNQFVNIFRLILFKLDCIFKIQCVVVAFFDNVSNAKTESTNTNHNWQGNRE